MKDLNILVLGSGGREHAISWKLKQSPRANKLFVAPGNAGTAELATNVNLSLSDFDAIADFVRSNEISLLLVGPEAPLVDGIIDYFKSKTEFEELLLIGPDSAGAELEGSKDFAKEFMAEFAVPTAAYSTFDAKQLDDAYLFLESLKPPYVLKADGLAAGKGVVILNDLNEAKIELKQMLLDKKFGEASAQVVIEEYLNGIEMSVFVLTDGRDYLILPEAKDYKRIGEGDTGLNTGGMGAVSPVPFADKVLMDKIEEQVVKPSVNGLAKRGFDYKGFLFIGLMIVEGEPFVIEYNVRMGDPETEVVMPRIKSDFLEHLIACGRGDMAGQNMLFEEQAACTVMLVSGGYPESYEKGKEITGLNTVKGSLLFHAGTSLKEGKVQSSGGRVIAITSLANTKNEALETSYANAALINYDGKYYRRDIGKDLD